MIGSRFVRASGVYLIGVTVVLFGYANIGYLTDYYTLAAMAAIALGGVLALYLGYASGSIWSVLLLGVGIGIAELPDTPLAQGNFVYWEGFLHSLPHFWQPYTLIVFLPAWIVGRYVGFKADRSLVADLPRVGN